MQKKALGITIFILLALGTLSAAYYLQPSQATRPDIETQCTGIVDKKPSEAFTVRIAFKNKGTTEGTWRVAVTFEGNSWTWESEEKLLTLRAGEKKALVWEGQVPEDAPIDSIARLIVYYNGEFVALNWWIHVVPGAELCIMDSRVS